MSTRSNYAIKIIDKALGDSDSRILHSTLREINILRHVFHPNIVQLKEVYESQKHLYLVMQLVQGGTLHSKLVYGKPMREDFVADLTRKLFGALKYLHEKGIVHHDLKP